MRSNYKPIGDYIQLVDNRNSELKELPLIGVTVNKKFIPSVANTVGTNMKNYKIIKKNQFACSLMQVRRDGKIPVALMKDDEAIISQAYPVFEIVDNEELLPEYLMMWMSRSEFDREACFYAVGGVRGSLEWEDFCAMQLPVPSPEKQKEIVREYHTITDRIKLNESFNQKLEDTAQSVYKEWFKKWESNNLLQEQSLNELCSLITDGKHGDCQNELNSGYYFVSVKDLEGGEINYENARQITKKDFEETDKRTSFKEGDILFSNSGTIGRMIIAKDHIETRKTTFQKSVAILKPKQDMAKSYYLYSLLKHNIKDIQELASGTSQSNLLLGSFRQFVILYPGYDEVCNYEKQVKPVFKVLDNKRKENKHLKQLKEVLLSKMATIED